jgi:putative hydrolase of the HAD superfamily
MITAVTFDVWETMIHDDPALGAARGAHRVARIAEALHRAGFPFDELQVRRAYDESWRQCEQSWAAGREVDPHDQLLTLLAALDSALPARLDAAALASVEDAYVDPIFTHPPGLNEGLVDALRALRDAGSRLGLICNTGRTPGYAMRRLLDRYGVIAYFDALAFSNEEGIRKPDPEIFRRVLARLAVPAAEAVHVGDDVVTDISGAKHSGMRAVLFRQRYPANLPVAPDAYIKSLGELLPALERLDGGVGPPRRA